MSIFRRVIRLERNVQEGSLQQCKQVFADLRRVYNQMFAPLESALEFTLIKIKSQE